MKGEALVFGLNYQYDEKASLQGCINDANRMSSFLRNKLKIPVRTLNDIHNRNQTSRKGIIRELRKLAKRTRKNKLDLVWLHFSGHGNQTKKGKGERDRKNEVIYPSDFRQNGTIVDNLLNKLLSRFWHRTKIICVFDCCHSGTILDLRYSWRLNGKSRLENNKCRIKAKTICFSGCLDNQTASDTNAFSQKFSGAMTHCLLHGLIKEGTEDIFEIYNSTSRYLKRTGFTQLPLLSSNFDLGTSSHLFE